MGLLPLGSAWGTLVAQRGTALTQQVRYGGSERDLLRAELRAGLAYLGVPRLGTRPWLTSPGQRLPRRPGPAR